MRELVVDGKTGFLVEDVRAMADAIGQLPRITARDCRDMGKPTLRRRRRRGRL